MFLNLKHFSSTPVNGPNNIYHIGLLHSMIVRAKILKNEKSCRKIKIEMMPSLIVNANKYKRTAYCYNDNCKFIFKIYLFFKIQLGYKNVEYNTRNY